MLVFFGITQAYRIVDEYLRSKQQQQQLPDLGMATAEPGSAAHREREKRANELAAALEAEVPMSSVVDDDEEPTAILSASTNVDVGSGGESQPTAVADLGEAVVVDDGEDEPLHHTTHYEGDGEDEEEREAEARTAGMRLFILDLFFILPIQAELLVTGSDVQLFQARELSLTRQMNCWG